MNPTISDRFANSLNAPQNAQNRDAIIASLRPEQQNTLARRGITGNFNVTPSPTIPSNVLGSNITPGDVFQRRAQMEQQQNAQLEASRALTNAEGVAQAPRLDATSFVNSILAEAPTQTEQAQVSGLDKVSSALGNLFGRGARTQELQNQAGLPQMQQELLKVNQQLAQAKAAFDTAIGNVPTEAGITAGGAEARVSALSNARAAQVGALASLSQAYQGNIQLAQQFAKDAVDLEFMDREQAVANELQMIELRKDTLSREDKRRAERLQVALQRQEAELAAQKADRQSVMSAITEAAKNGAPQSLVQAASRLRDPMQAISMLSQYMANPMDLAIKSAQLRQERAAAVKAENANIKNETVIEKTGDPTIDFLANIKATEGGKPVTDTTIQKLDKGLTVLGQLGVLQQNIQNVRTGPITGAFRGANPWDTNAQVIKSSLNAVVPNLARGIYGEVGVLTDNDIAIYSKTLPNLNSTESVRNALLYITLDMIGKSIKNTLSVNAAAGRDVSGFTDLYLEMENTKNSILQTIPGAQVPAAFLQNQNVNATENDPMGIL